MSTQRSSAVLLDGVKLPDGASPAAPPVVTYKDLFFRFVMLGWIAFGGPTAHIALFQKVHIPCLTHHPECGCCWHGAHAHALLTCHLTLCSTASNSSQLIPCCPFDKP